MSVTPDDFLQSALAFAASGLSEINQRNGISRAYYASYHQACTVIAPDRMARYKVTQDGTKRTVGMHTGYIEQLKEFLPGTVERQVGVKLGAIYSGRITADYKLEEIVSPKSYSMQIARTQDLFQLLKKNAVSNPPQTPPAATQPTAAPTQKISKPPNLRVVK